MPHTLGKSQLHRRLRRLEADRSLKASLLVETGTYYRQLLAERIRAIGTHFDAARERGEEVPTADPEEVKEMLRIRFGWPNESLPPSIASASPQRGRYRQPRWRIFTNA